MHFRTGDNYSLSKIKLPKNKLIQGLIAVISSSNLSSILTYVGQPLTYTIIHLLKFSDRIVFNLTKKYHLTRDHYSPLKHAYIHQKFSPHKSTHDKTKPFPNPSIYIIRYQYYKVITFLHAQFFLLRLFLHKSFSQIYNLFLVTHHSIASSFSLFTTNLFQALHQSRQHHTKKIHRFIYTTRNWIFHLTSNLHQIPVKLYHTQVVGFRKTKLKLSKTILVYRSHTSTFLKILTQQFSITKNRLFTFVQNLTHIPLHFFNQLPHKSTRVVNQLHQTLISFSATLILFSTFHLHFFRQLFQHVASQGHHHVQRVFSTISKLIVNTILTTQHDIKHRLTIAQSLFLSFFSKLTQLIHRIVFVLISIPTQTTHILQLIIYRTKAQIVNSPLFHLSSQVASSTHSILTQPHTLRFRYLFLFFFLASAYASIMYFYSSIIKDLPNPSLLATTTPRLSTKIYDRNGTLLYKLYKKENRTLIGLNQIPLHLQHATIAIEDQEFYQHSGISFRGILRAFKVNLAQTGFQGGSTITQQLIKNTLLTPERTLTRKLKEIIVSVLTEFYFTKDEILTMYFNQVPYGGTAYGIEEASRMYFGKSASELDLAESAFLAGLPAAPTTYSPYGTNPSLAKNRQQQVLSRMVEDGYISETEAAKAIQEPLNISPYQNPISAPHFVMYVKDLLVQKYGLRMVEQGGLKIVTSLDLNLQNQVEQKVKNEVDSLSKLNVTNGAAIVTHPQTGEILAMVGSIDYFNTARDGQVNVTIRPRQPGSSIKPINYAVALENGFTPSTLIPDSPICYNTPGQPPYCPKNYDNRFHGNVTLRKALANSYNVPAVKTLFQFGVGKMVEYGQKLGITTWDNPSRFGLALTLGGGEVKMIDMAVVYGTFANLGLRVDPNPVLKITDSQGKVIEQNCTDPQISPNSIITSSPMECSKERVLDPRVAYQITDILSDNLARASAFGTHSVLNIDGHQVAVKTGTTNNLRDNWTIGYTNDYVVVTWVGNNNNTPMSYIASGITGASPMWNKIITPLINPNTAHQFTPPTNLNKVAICTLTGTLACNGCPTKEEYFIPGTEPTTHCNQEQIARLLNPHDSSN